MTMERLISLFRRPNDFDFVDDDRRRDFSRSARRRRARILRAVDGLSAATQSYGSAAQSALAGAETRCALSRLTLASPRPAGAFFGPFDQPRMLERCL